MAAPGTDPAPAGPASPVVAVTGATGFLGRHVITRLADAGVSVRALARPSLAADLAATETRPISWIAGRLHQHAALEQLLAGADGVIHLAGLVKALDRDGFFTVNATGSTALFKVAAATNVRHVLLVSTLAAREPHLSAYGASKRAAEQMLEHPARAGLAAWPFGWTVVRPPAIYGPGDMEILTLFKAMRFGLLPAPGSRHNRFSMIHADDMAGALVALSLAGIADPASHQHKVYEMDDGTPGGYGIHDVAGALAPHAPGGRRPRVVPVPGAVLQTLGLGGGLIGRLRGRPLTLDRDRGRFLAHPDWVVTKGRVPRLENWQARHTLVSGLADTIAWYRDHGYL
ncbi:NAD-dependent epimerase/dehydratase family protein [Yunchengibacter salinarum]|uniref:NAD-dependent epimerase/dehydratase family protein n=1 Tax=Yunchengibacter salinarum TaxID=3133399 RepID=UPI0035B5CF94